MRKRSRKIPIKYALRKIRSRKPSTPKEFKAIGLPLRFIGSGAFRSVRKIVNCDLVVKFPLESDVPTGRKHTLSEVRRLARLRKSRVMQPHLPEMFYIDKVHGILVMRFYPKYDSFEEQADSMGRLIQRLIYAHTRTRTSDIHTENVNRRRTNNEGAVLIDLGY